MAATATARWAIGFASGAARRLRPRAVTRSLYEVLGLPSAADEAQIKTAYRELARRLHPDVNAGSAEADSAERLAEVNHAYEVLSDPRARSAYDHALASQRSEMRRHWQLLGVSSAVTFVITLGAVSYLVRWHLQTAPQAEPVVVAGEALDRGAPPPAPGAIPAVSEGTAGPGLPPVAEGARWSTFRNPRFGFTLRYPAGIFAFDPAQSDANLHTFVSRDRRTIFRIVAAENAGDISLARFRSTLIKQRYTGAVFEQTPRGRHWFLLSGTQGQEVFVERITFSCDGKSMHGWQMRYPANQRATYDEVAKLVLRNPGNEPGADCESKPRAKAQARR